MDKEKIFKNPRLQWFSSEKIRPYLYVRQENQIPQPGSVHDVNWFERSPLYKNPLQMSESAFGEHILSLEGQAFGPSDMAMPRWVFVDCSVVPGFVAGFAAQLSLLPEKVRPLFSGAQLSDWVPISLFIIIPTMSEDNEWVAHNLCTVNTLLEKDEKFFGLGFLSKAFGLWYANVKTCIGFTQWGNHAIKLHTYYGEFEVLTVYTPIHSKKNTVTYRLNVNHNYWPLFFTKQAFPDFVNKFEPTDLEVHPQSEAELIKLQKIIEAGTDPLFLKPHEVVLSDLASPLKLYRPKK